MFESNLPLPLAQPRIMGLETEYMFIPQVNGAANLDNSLLGKALPSDIHINSSFLSNGARFYMDTGSHPEYATPECLTGRGVAIAAAAGEIITGATVGTALSHVPKIAQNFGLFKRTVDSKGVVAGDHENYYVTRNTLPSSVAPRLVPHLVSRILFTGPGMVDRDGLFSIDQRAWSMSNEDIGSTSTKEHKPFLLSREEDHSKNGRRVQVMSGSANMMGQAIQFRFDSTSLALRLVEHGKIPKWLRVENPGYAIQNIASEHLNDSLKFKERVRLGNGSYRTAAELQYEYASRAYLLGEAGDLNEYDAQFARRWVEMSQDAMDGKIDKWKNEIEWLTKLELLLTYKSGRESVSIERMKQLDMKFHEVVCLRAQTIQTKLKKAGRIALIANGGAIKQACYEAPDDTRARVRGNAITALARGALPVTAYGNSPLVPEWLQWPITDRRMLVHAEGLRLLQADPYSTEDDFAKVTGA